MPLSGTGGLKKRSCPSAPAAPADKEAAVLSYKQTLPREARCELQDIFQRVCSSIPAPPLHPLQLQLAAEGRTVQEEEVPQLLTLEHLSQAISSTTHKDVSMAALRSVMAVMDVQHRGEVDLHDFMEYAAHRLHLDAYATNEELHSSEQGLLMQEQGHCFIELLRMFRRRDMLHDVMQGGDARDHVSSYSPHGELLQRPGRHARAKKPIDTPAIISLDWQEALGPVASGNGNSSSTHGQPQGAASPVAAPQPPQVEPQEAGGGQGHGHQRSTANDRAAAAAGGDASAAIAPARHGRASPSAVPPLCLPGTKHTAAHANEPCSRRLSSRSKQRTGRPATDAAAAADAPVLDTARIMSSLQEEMQRQAAALGLPPPAEGPVLFDTLSLRAQGTGSSCGTPLLRPPPRPTASAAARKPPPRSLRAVLAAAMQRKARLAGRDQITVDALKYRKRRAAGAPSGSRQGVWAKPPPRPPPPTSGAASAAPAAKPAASAPAYTAQAATTSRPSSPSPAAAPAGAAGAAGATGVARLTAGTADFAALLVPPPAPEHKSRWGPALLQRVLAYSRAQAAGVAERSDHAGAGGRERLANVATGNRTGRHSAGGAANGAVSHRRSVALACSTVSTSCTRPSSNSSSRCTSPTATRPHGKVAHLQDAAAADMSHQHADEAAAAAARTCQARTKAAHQPSALPGDWWAAEQQLHEDSLLLQLPPWIRDQLGLATAGAPSSTARDSTVGPLLPMGAGAAERAAAGSAGTTGCDRRRPASVSCSRAKGVPIVGQPRAASAQLWRRSRSPTACDQSIQCGHDGSYPASSRPLSPGLSDTDATDWGREATVLDAAPCAQAWTHAAPTALPAPDSCAPPAIRLTHTTWLRLRAAVDRPDSARKARARAGELQRPIMARAMDPRPDVLRCAIPTPCLDPAHAQPAPTGRSSRAAQREAMLGALSQQAALSWQRRAVLASTGRATAAGAAASGHAAPADSQLLARRDARRQLGLGQRRPFSALASSIST